MKRALVAALLAALSGADAAFAHQVGRNDKLLWQAPCDIRYTDGDAFERLKPHHCDFLTANNAGEAQRFNAELTLSQQRAFLFKNDDDADAALSELKKAEKELKAATDPDQPGERSPEGKARKLVEDKAKVQQEAERLSAPFGGKTEYRKELDKLAAKLDAELKETTAKLSDKEKKLVARMEAQLADTSGTTGGLKKMEGLKGAAASNDGGAAAGSAAFDKGTRGSGAAAEPGQGGQAKVEGTGQGDQLAKGAAGADKVQKGYGKDDFRKISQSQGERLGDASANRGIGSQLVEAKSNLFPAEPAKKFSQSNIIYGPGVSQEAKNEAVRVVDKMLEKAPDTVKSNLEANKVKIVIVPKGGNLADYAPELKNQRTIDGRCFTLCYNPSTGRNEVGEVKAVADIPLRDGSVACLVPEENLIGKGPKDSRGFPKDFTTVHEFSHMVELYGLPKSRTPGQVYDDYMGTPDPKRVPTLDTVEWAYRDGVKTSGMDAYGKADHREYFAQYSSAWFGKHNNGITAEQLKRTDPAMYKHMENIYGQPPSAIG